ncbi:hypothetical protein NC652_024415 [Populus alba x Populus x berolinensis]|nr:hypothetical protein NC652_024415 [Populus alba x Populus x berolinensis]
MQPVETVRQLVLRRPGDSAQLEKDQSAGFLQQTGEQVKHVAEDAMDSVKNTLGIGQNKK